MSSAMIDPGVVTLIQSNFLQQLAGAFSTVSGYALNLLYIFAGFELVILGIAWALQHEPGFGKLFFKIIKIGLIFVVIQNYPDLLNSIINSFATIAGVVVSKAKVGSLIFNPAQLWQYGYNIGLHLLQSATTTNALGLVLVLTILGMGILLVFGLLGIQIVLQLVGFYLVALVSLIMLPFGTFDPGRKMFDRAVQAVLQSGVRVMVVIIVIGVASLVWDGFDFRDMAEKTVSLNQTLGLFFTALLFLFLAIYLPRFAAAAVGSISDFMTTQHVVVEGGGGAMTFAAPMVAAGSDLSNMQTATAVEGGIGASGQGLAAAATTQAAVEVAATNVGGGVGGGKTGSASSSNGLLSPSILGQAAGGSGGMGPNFSLKTLKKLKDALQKIE
jgi:P-type conjugative transfer protein TrbL